MTTASSCTPQNKTFTDFGGFSSTNNERDFNTIADCLIDSNIYVALEPDKKYTTDTGWNNKTNLLTKEEAKDNIENGGNLAIVLGKWFNSEAYIAFDIEREEAIPENLKAIIDSHALETHTTLHDNSNRIVRVGDKQTYQTLHDLGESHSNLSEGTDTDLEILTAGSCVIPPSQVSHTYCSDQKPCNGKGEGAYSLLSTNPEAPTLDLDSVKEIADILGKDIELEEPDYSEEEVDENVPSPTPKFNIQKEYENNVPSVNQSFNERLNYMKYGDWKGQELFIKLYNGNFESISGSQKQGKGELKLANYIGFFFGNNEKMVRLVMSMVPFESHYEKYESHRKTLLEYATSVDWVYCDEVRLETKLVIASRIWINETISQEELAQYTDISKRHIRRIIPILEAENVIETENKDGKQIYKNMGITEGYITKLENIADERDKNNNRIEKTSNVERSMI